MSNPTSGDDEDDEEDESDDDASSLFDTFEVLDWNSIWELHPIPDPADVTGTLLEDNDSSEVDSDHGAQAASSVEQVLLPHPCGSQLPLGELGSLTVGCDHGAQAASSMEQVLSLHPCGSQCLESPPILVEDLGADPSGSCNAPEDEHVVSDAREMLFCPMMVSMPNLQFHDDSGDALLESDSTLMSDSTSKFLDCDDSGFVDVGLFLTAMSILEVAIRAASRDDLSCLALLRMWMHSFKFLSKSPYSVPLDTLMFITAATLRVVAGMFTGSPLLSTIVRDFGAVGTSQPYAARLHRNSIGLLVKFSQERKSSLSPPCPDAEFFELYHKVLGYVTIPPEATESNVEPRTRTSKNHYASSSSHELAESSSFAHDQIDYSLNSAVVTTISASQRRGKRARRCRTPSCVAMQVP